MSNLIDLFKGEPISVTIRRIVEGLKSPKDSGEYKYARYAMSRIIGPPCISFVCSVVLILTAVFMAEAHVAIQEKNFEAIDAKLDIKDTKDVVPEPEKPKIEEITETTENPNLEPGPVSPIQTAGPKSDYMSGDDSSPKDGVGGDIPDIPVIPYAVVMTKSPIIIPKLYGNRTEGGRQRAGDAYGGGGAGIKVTEKSVLLALRWLKKYQEEDGSWTKDSGGGSGGVNGTPALTGLALMCFLAHGETPASVEFGTTVEKAIRWLCENQQADGRWVDKGGEGYSLPIGAYALCEAYGMTKLPTIQSCAEKSIDAIIKGQHINGGWDYNAKIDNRNDTSVMAWCAQALKAAHVANLSNKDIKPAMKKAIEGFKCNSKTDASGYGGFGYDGPNSGLSMTGAGTLCMQLLGASKDKECQNGLLSINQIDFDWEKGVTGTTRPLYHWYYITQARFHNGGASWTTWNKQFSPALTKNQIVLLGLGIDNKDIGYWNSPAKDEPYGRVYSTTLCCLMLEVYYRTLPTFKTPEQDNEIASVITPVDKNKTDSNPKITIE